MGRAKTALATHCRLSGRAYSRCMPGDLLRLPARSRDGALHVVVETPRDSRAKLKYSPTLGAFVLSRALALGVTYPFDWGFVPSTQAPDGDPLDAMIVSDVSTHPGVVVCCRALAVLRVEQNAKEGGRQRNDRLIVEPLAIERPTLALAPRVREELEAFFLSSTLFADKDLRFLGWDDAAAADAIVDRSAAGPSAAAADG
jgi:inorganic pyrophosphatase